MNRFENPLTKQDVDTIVERSLGTDYRIHNYYVKSYSNNNLGLFGAHRNFIVEVSKKGSTHKELYTYFLKSVPYNLNDQAKFVNESKMFYKETNFYNLIMPELTKCIKDKSWTPKCYLVKDDALVFEHLVIKNYALRDDYLDVASIEAALSSLANLHAASLLAEERLGKTFIEMYPEFLEEVLFSREGAFADWNRSGIDLLIEVAKYLRLDHSIVFKLCNLIYEKLKPSKTRKNVISHGDVWSNNLMFNGSKCVLVDFQLLRYVPPMIDVLQLIYLTSKKEFRDKCEIDWLKHYHKILCDVIENGGLDAPRFDDILEEYEDMRIVGLVMINMYFPVLKIANDKKAELMQTSEGFNNILFRDRVGLVLGLMETDERYKEIVSSALKELVNVAPKYLVY